MVVAFVVTQSRLLTKLEDLGKIANKAVFSHDLGDSFIDKDETKNDDESETYDNEDDEQVDSKNELNDWDINILFQRI